MFPRTADADEFLAHVANFSFYRKMETTPTGAEIKPGLAGLTKNLLPHNQEEV
jgi:hypothetical protein